ncbi:MAG: hypothetical protein Q8Q59_15775 [Luteolibacter sp.]|nr:hypothetical protein [Luteolibacter sp.]
MLVSIYQIDFIDTATGGSTRLLSTGELLDKMIDFSFSQQAEGYASIGSDWGKSQALGGARRPLEWTRQCEHAHHAAAAAWCIRHPAGLPFTRPGKLRVTIQDGETWDLLDAVLLSASARPDKGGDFATLTSYKAEAGKTLPVYGLAHYAGIPHAWILTAHEDQLLTTENV